MSKIADTEANATSLDGLVNENGLITTLRNGPKPSWQYIVDQVYAQLGYAVAGSFVDGFTYTGIRQVGADASGNTWIYTGGEQNLPHVVPAGTVPSAPDYFQVSVNSADNVVLDNGENLQQAIDRLNLEIVDLESNLKQELTNSIKNIDELKAASLDLGSVAYVDDTGSFYEIVSTQDLNSYNVKMNNSTYAKRIDKGNTKTPLLMSYYNLPQFQGGQLGLRLAYSNDGVSFTDITGNSTPNTDGTTPSVVFYRNAWYMVGDISANAGFPIYKSKDLITWETIAENVIPSGLPTFYNIWDVDFIQGTGDTLYLAYSVNTNPATTPDVSEFYPYYSEVLDIDSASIGAGVAILSDELSSSSSYIDFNATYFNGKYHATVKEERLGSRAIFTLTSDSIGGNWSGRNDVIVSELPVYEAPCLTVVGDELFLYYDRISNSNTTSKSYFYRKSSDGLTWTDEQYIDIDVTNIRHCYVYALSGDREIESLANNVSLTSEINTSNTLSIPVGTTFALTGGVTDSVGGLSPTNSSTIKGIGSGVSGGAGKNQFQFLPSGYFGNEENALWVGAGSVNLTSTFDYSASSNVSTVDGFDSVEITVQSVSSTTGISWGFSVTSGLDYTVSCVVGANLHGNLKVFDGSGSEVTTTEISNNSHVSKMFTATSSGSYEIRFVTEGMSVNDFAVIKNVQAEQNKYSTPYLGSGVTRDDGVLLYQGEQFDLSNKFIMTRYRANHNELNDYFMAGSFRPDGDHTRLRPLGLNNTEPKDVFVFVSFDENMDVSFGYWETEDDSGRLDIQNFYDGSLPETPNFLQLSKVGNSATFRMYEYFILGDFNGSSFDRDGEVDQSLVSLYSKSSIHRADVTGLEKLGFTPVYYDDKGRLPNYLTQTNGAITGSGNYTPKPEETLVMGSIGSVSISINSSSLKNGDSFYLLLASSNVADSLTVLNGGSTVTPDSAGYTISVANENNQALVEFVRSATGTVRKKI